MSLKKFFSIIFLMIILVSCQTSDEKVLMNSQKPLELAVTDETINLKDAYFVSHHSKDELSFDEEDLNPSQGELYVDINDDLNTGSIWGKVWLDNALYQVKFSRFYGKKAEYDGGVRAGGSISIAGIGDYESKLAAFGSTYLLQEKSLIGSFETIFWIDSTNTAHMYLYSDAENNPNKYYLRFNEVISKSSPYL